jgi:osmotically-inducible protein OsmY
VPLSAVYARQPGPQPAAVRIAAWTRDEAARRRPDGDDERRSASASRAIERRIGLSVGVALSGRDLTLTGRVDSAAARAAAADVARHLAPGCRVRDRLVVVEPSWGATTDLAVEVTVRGGVVRLRGAVAGLEDADDVQEVASRVPGVVEVVDELVVAAL